MAILVLLFCFISIFCNLSIVFYKRTDVKMIALYSVLIFSVLIVFITEISSALHVFNFPVLFVTWSGILIINMPYIYLKRKLVREIIGYFKVQIQQFTYRLSRYEKRVILTVLSILSLVAAQGMLYPPNNWDSMTYHLARVENWMLHQTVAHYPSHIIRQLYQPPFSEFVIAHFNILSRGDYFSNWVELFYLLATVIAVVSIIELLNLTRKYKLLAVVLVLTIPVVILQASSTQNDIISSFFLLTALILCMKVLRELKIIDFLFFGISVGLAVLTKGTAYIYLAPFLLIFSVMFVVNWYRTKNHAHLKGALVAVVLFISLTSGYYVRNISFSGNMLGTVETESKMILSDRNSPVLLFSSVIKNASLHLGPIPFNNIVTNAVYKIHDFLGIDANSPGINYLNIKYAVPLNISTHDDVASNTFHFMLILLAFCVLGFQVVKGKGQLESSLYLGLILLQGLLFCYLLKWQPWHTRLHTPLFILSVPLICYAAARSLKYSKVVYGLLPVIIFSTFLMIVFNRPRPYIAVNPVTSGISVTDSRVKKYFSNRLYLYPEYAKVVSEIETARFKNVGLLIGVDDWEYPLTTQLYRKGINFESICVSNISRFYGTSLSDIDCIVSTTSNKEFLDYNGARYYNRGRDNKFIWLYDRSRVLANKM